jgi:Spx/MgsR family transcriptional regulator
VEIYVHPTCTSCKKAEALLGESGVEVQRRDYFKDRFSKDELRGVLDKAGVTPGEVLSKRATAYRELQLEGRDISEDALLDLMVEYPTLLRRPLLIGSGGSTVGFNADKINKLVEMEG